MDSVASLIPSAWIRGSRVSQKDRRCDRYRLTTRTGIPTAAAALVDWRLGLLLLRVGAFLELLFPVAGAA